MSESLLEKRIGHLSAAAQRLLVSRLISARPQRRPERLVAFVTSNSIVDEEDIRAFCVAHLPGYMVPQAVVRVSRLPRTPAGKIDRQILAQTPIELPTRNPDPSDAGVGDGPLAPRSKEERILADIWADVLGVEEVGVTDDFFELGGDSLLSIRVLSRATKAGLTIDPEAFLAHPTVAQQALFATKETREAPNNEPAAGTLPLTPVQLWLFEHVTTNTEHWNQSVWVSVPRRVSLSTLESALERLVARHDALRTAFIHLDGEWRQQVIGSADKFRLRHIDVSVASERAETERRVIDELNAGFDLADPPLVRAATFDRGTDEDPELLLVFHHLIVDEVSLSVLVEDLDALCGQILGTGLAAAETSTTPFSRWAEHLGKAGSAGTFDDQVEYWTRHAPQALASLPALTSAGTANVEATAQIATVYLDAAVTMDLVRLLPQVLNSQLSEALLAALAAVLAQWTGNRAVFIHVEGHGRESLSSNLDVARTVGWFTTVYPVWLHVPAESGPGLLLAEVKEQLRSIPSKGIGYGVLREHGRPEIRERLRAIPHPEVCFNFLGRQESRTNRCEFLTEGRAHYDRARSPHCKRAYAFEINAFIDLANCLRINWTYSASLHDAPTIQHLATAYKERLKALAAFARAPDGIIAAPSDFPLAGLEIEELAVLAKLIDQADAPPRK